ncbi:hypothetical protein AB0F15_39290 [Amycolatopsis sp. NPDC026612]|uniref:hypothetical protein n=1 Tax=Amycolatopsis sp. NPDC026612 TaxID=3155466 RepID=UPI00340EE3E0
MIALAAIAVVGLTGCDGPDPDNLETYYDDPVPTSSAPPPPPAPAAPRTAEVPVSPAKATPVAPDLGGFAQRALLTDADVAEEGVQPGSGAVSGCLDEPAAAGSRTATWRYPSGSVLSHHVVAYPEQAAAAAVAAVDCAGKTVTVPAQPGIDRQRAWCEGKTCTVLLAKGRLVSALTVSASTETRAVDAAKRLLSAMTAKLAAQP